MSRPGLRRAGRRVAGWALHASSVAGGHPRHLVLGGLVAGLLLGPLSAPGVLAAALAVLVLPRRAGLGLCGAIAVLGGAALAETRLAALDGGALPAMEGRTAHGAAVLLEPVRARRSGMRSARLRFRGEVVAGRVGPEAVWPGGLEVGEEVVVRGRIERLSRGERYQRPRGAQVALVVTAGRRTGRRRGGLAGDLDAVRGRAQRALSAGLAAPQAGLLRGMVLGDDEGIAEPVREEFRRSGLAHLTAASGQNVMLLAVLAIAVATALGAGLRARLGVALALVVLYVPLAGGGPSIQRAGVMGAAGLVAALAGRPASRWYAVGLAAAVTLALNPRAAQEPGWQLSFAAVVALLALAPPIREALVRRGGPRAFADVAAITVAATLGTAPLMALHFEAVSLASLPANLLAAPAVVPVMWLGMLAAAVGQASMTLAAPLTWLAAYPVAYVEWVANVAAAPAAASATVRLPGPWAVAAAYAGMAALGLGAREAWRRHGDRLGVRRGRDARAALGLAAMATVLAIGLALRGPAPPPRAAGELVVSFLDVGQGDATLLQHDDTAVLFDTGPPGGPVLARLREAGVHGLDALVITHAQADHEGMADAVLRAHRTRLVLNGGAGGATVVQRGLPEAARRAGAQVAPVRAGERLRLGDLEVRILWPPPAPSALALRDADPNLRAVVAHVRLGEFDLLLPADAESEVTAGLDLPAVEALKVAHHGSDDEGLPGELARLRPHFAAIEVGRANTYGHPTAATLAALRAVPRVVRTDRDGTVRLRVVGGRMRVDRGRF